MSTALRFVKGHCGWDTVTLLPEGQIPRAAELDAALSILSPPVDGGLEVGVLGVGSEPDQISLRMVSSTAKDWIPMCGGMTQVIGKALVDTFLRDHFNVDVTRPHLAYRLMTPSGAVPIRIELADGKFLRVVTTMDSYVSYLYAHGVERLTLRDVPLLRVGTYAVIGVDDLTSAHPHLDFTRRDFGPHLDVVNDVLREFGERLGITGVNGMLYDERPEGPGQYRVFPRFYSEDLAAARVPWEFQCGTGSIAVAVALVHSGCIERSARNAQLLLEWGSYRTTPDPYGIRISQLHLTLESERLTAASFAHSVVEILSEGTLVLPRYVTV